MKNTTKRLLATPVAMGLVAWFMYQLAWVYWTSFRVWEWGYIGEAWYPYCYGAAGLGAVIVFGLSWITRPKTVDAIETVETKEEAVTRTNYETIMKYGTDEEKKWFVKNHPEFFGANKADKAEKEEPLISNHSQISPRAPSSPPETRALAVRQEGNEIIIRVENPTPQVRMVNKIDRNNGSNSNFHMKLREQLEATTLKKLENGDWIPDFSINLDENGKYTLPSQIKVKQAPKTKKPKPDKKAASEPKPQEKVKDPIIPDISPIRQVNGKDKK